MTIISRSVLIFRIGQLGDTIVALPAIWAVRKHFPEARLTLLSDQHPGKPYVRAADIFEGTDMFCGFEAYPVPQSVPGRLLGPFHFAVLLARLRAQRFDTLVYLAPSSRSRRQVKRDRGFFAAAGIKQFIGMVFLAAPPTAAWTDPAGPHP